MPDSSGLGNDGPESHSDSPRIKLNSCLEETSQLVVGGKQTDCLWLIGTIELTQALGEEMGTRWRQTVFDLKHRGTVPKDSMDPG